MTGVAKGKKAVDKIKLFSMESVTYLNICKIYNNAQRVRPGVSIGKCG